MATAIKQKASGLRHFLRLFRICFALYCYFYVQSLMRRSTPQRMSVCFRIQTFKGWKKAQQKCFRVFMKFGSIYFQSGFMQITLRFWSISLCSWPLYASQVWPYSQWSQSQSPFLGLLIGLKSGITCSRAFLTRQGRPGRLPMATFLVSASGTLKYSCMDRQYVLYHNQTIYNKRKTANKIHQQLLNPNHHPLNIIQVLARLIQSKTPKSGSLPLSSPRSTRESSTWARQFSCSSFRAEGCEELRIRSIYFRRSVQEIWMGREGFFWERIRVSSYCCFFCSWLWSFWRVRQDWADFARLLWNYFQTRLPYYFCLLVIALSLYKRKS